MSIRAGQFVWTGNELSAFGLSESVLDRIQNAGPSSLNIPEERIYEDGNPRAVGIVRDIPDIGFDLESWDATADLEGILLGFEPADLIDGQELDFANAIPLDILSSFRTKLLATTTVGGLIGPSLSLESAAYRYAVKQNAGETFTLKGDSLFWVPGSPWRESFAHAGTGPYSLDETAILFDDLGDDTFVVAACWVDVDGTYKRLFHGLDYTDTSGALTLTSAAAALMPVTATLRVMYGTSTAKTLDLQVTSGTAVKPAALRTKDIDVYVSDGAATPSLVRWDGVQNVELNWRVTLQGDEEFGNAHYVTQDYDSIDVAGTLGVKPSDVVNLFQKLAYASDRPTDEVIGLLSSTPLEMEIRLRHPETHQRLKTHYVADARFQLPAFQARANSRQEFPFPFKSEEGQLQTYVGER